MPGPRSFGNHEHESPCHQRATHVAALPPDAGASFPTVLASCSAPCSSSSAGLVPFLGLSFVHELQCCNVHTAHSCRGRSVEDTAEDARYRSKAARICSSESLLFLIASRAGHSGRSPPPERYRRPESPTHRTNRGSSPIPSRLPGRRTFSRHMTVPHLIWMTSPSNRLRVPTFTDDPPSSSGCPATQLSGVSNPFSLSFGRPVAGVMVASL